MKSVDSAANPRFKTLRRLVESSRERKQAGRSVLDGAHLVAAYRKHVGRPETVVVSRRGLENPEIRALLEATGGADALDACALGGHPESYGTSAERVDAPDGADGLCRGVIQDPMLVDVQATVSTWPILPRPDKTRRARESHILQAGRWACLESDRDSRSR